MHDSAGVDRPLDCRSVVGDAVAHGAEVLDLDRACAENRRPAHDSDGESKHGLGTTLLSHLPFSFKSLMTLNITLG